MSLGEEKLLILKMLEEGKITSDEAASLLDALDGNIKKQGEDSQTKQAKNGFQEEIQKARVKLGEWKQEFKNNYNQKDFDKMVDDFSTKAEKLGKNVASTTVGIVDKVVDFVGSFVDTNAFNIFGSYSPVERSFEVDCIEGMNLNIEGINGHIIVKRHSEEKIIIKSVVRSPLNNVDSILAFISNENGVFLTINKDINVSVSHEVLLPEKRFENIKLNTSNGKILVEDSLSDYLEAQTRNCYIELVGTNSNKINLNTKNARIQLSYVAGQDIDLNTANSLIDVKHIKTQILKATTMNSRISAEGLEGFEGKDIDLFLKTSNGGIKVNMNDSLNMGYKVKAKTSCGGINLLIPDLNYSDIDRKGNLRNSAEAESKDLELFIQKVRIEAETSNGYIEIVK